MKLGVTLDILNQKDTPAFYADTLANRPAAGFTGRVFISTDTLDLYRDTGTTWVLLSPSSTGTITGSGAAGQVTYFSAASSITGSNNLFYDTGNSRLGVNTNTPTAPLDVHSSLSGALMQLNQTSGTLDSQLAFQSANVGKWRIGSYYNTGLYSFGIYDVANSLERFSVLNTGQTFVGSQTTSSGLLVVNSSTADNQIVAIGANSPSIRVRNAGTSPTQQFGLGLATATNNFIQGSASGDFCLFNGSTTASPMLLGIYDAGAGNVQEAARISAARNFLIGTTTDAGYKLNVNGNIVLSGNNGNIINLTNFSSNVFSIKSVNGGTDVGGMIINAGTGESRFGSFRVGGGYFTTLYVNGAELIRLSTSNNVLINTTTDAGYKLDVNGSGRIGSSTNNWIYNPATNSSEIKQTFNSTYFAFLFVASTTYPITASRETYVLQSSTSIKGFRFEASTGSSTMFVNTSGGASTDQYVNIGGNRNSQNSTSAILELESTIKGFLPPKMTTAQKNAIGTPATGLMVYDTTLNKLAVYTGATWETITSV